ELACNAANLHYRRSRGIGQHDRHLQEHAEKVADIICTVLGKAFCTVSALQEESFAFRDPRELFFQVARLARKHEWRKSRKLVFDVKQRLLIRIIRDLLNWLLAPTIRRPSLNHLATPELAGLIHDREPGRPLFPADSVIFGLTRPPRGHSSWLFRASSPTPPRPSGELPWSRQSPFLTRPSSPQLPRS